MFKKLLSIFEKRKDILKNVYDLYIFITLKDDKNISIWKKSWFWGMKFCNINHFFENLLIKK